MDKIGLKKELLKTCLSIEKEHVAQLKQEINEAQRLSNEYGAPKDRYDPYRTKLMRQRDLFAKQLDKAEQLVNALQKVPVEKEFTQVSFGAVVITDRQKIFVSAAIGKVDFRGESYYAISTLVPVYQAMEGKKAGETFQVNRNLFTIKEVW